MALGLLYVTHQSEDDAKKICKSLLDEKLIACANFFPITSVYQWDKEIVNDSEVVSLIKFNKTKIEEIEKRIEELHPYDIPCILRIPVSANKEFEKWVDKQ